MANRYIRHGATYCGDGTSKELATVNGGVGAWNDIAVFEGATPAYGTLPAGTTVFIRSKDEAGVDITLSYAVAKTLGQSAATEASPITWVIDDGAVWSGVSGVLTVNMTAQVLCTVTTYNNLIATNYNLVFKNTNTGGGSSFPGVQFGLSRTRSVKVDYSGNVNSEGLSLRINGGIHENLWARFTQTYSGTQHFSSDRNTTVLISPKIELLYAGNATSVFSSAGNNGGWIVYGGEISGVGATSSMALAVPDQYKSFHSFGLKYPNVMQIAFATAFGGTYGAYVMANGADGALGNAYADGYFRYDSRNDGYYPTLNASLELSAAPGWSYKLYPVGATPASPVRIHISKIYNQAAATKTVTLEFLWPASMAAPDTASCYMDVQYTDNTTGLKTHLTSSDMSGAPLTVSTAAWSAATYGPTAFTKYKISLTTTTSIKQDTEVMVSFFVAKKSASASDILFVDPDPVFS